MNLGVFLNTHQIKSSAIGILFLFLSGCNAVLYTSPIHLTNMISTPHGCVDSAGAYSLPKGELGFVVQEASAGAGGTRFKMKDVVVNGFISDRDHLYCLDYRSSAFASDVVNIDRNAQNLLTRVYSRNEDKTDDVLKKLSGAATQFIASKKRESEQPEDAGGNRIHLDQDVDPFNARKMVMLNQALYRFGYCVFVDKLNDPMVPAWMSSMCTDSRFTDLKNQPISPDVSTKKDHAHQIPYDQLGIFYRPVLAHSLVIMRKDDPGNPSEAWRVWRRKVIHLPNLAPPFVLQIKRAVFNTRKAEVILRAGVLDSVKLERDSTAEALSELIVSVVGDVVAIPAQALSIAFSETNAKAALIDANQKYIRALASYRQSQIDLQTAQKQAANSPALASDSTAYQRCIENLSGLSLAEAQVLCANNSVQ